MSFLGVFTKVLVPEIISLERSEILIYIVLLFFSKRITKFKTVATFSLFFYLFVSCEIETCSCSDYIEMWNTGCYCGVTASLLWIDFLFLLSIIWASIKFCTDIYCRLFPVSLCLQLLCGGNILLWASPLPHTLSCSLASVPFFLEELSNRVRLLLIDHLALGEFTFEKNLCH